MPSKKKSAKDTRDLQTAEPAMPTCTTETNATLEVTVFDSKGAGAPPIQGAPVCVYPNDNLKDCDLVTEAKTDEKGQAHLTLAAGTHVVHTKAFIKSQPCSVTLQPGESKTQGFGIPIGLHLECIPCQDNATQATCPDLIREGDVVELNIRFSQEIENQLREGTSIYPTPFLKPTTFQLSSDGGRLRKINDRKYFLETKGVKDSVTIYHEISQNPTLRGQTQLPVGAAAARSVSGDVSVTLGRTATAKTSDMPLWTVIRAATEAISFNNYKDFVDSFVCTNPPGMPTANGVDCSTRSLPFPGVDAYSLVKCASEVFLMTHCGVVLNSGFDFNNLFNNSDITLLEEQARFGREIDSGDLNSLWTEYLVPVNGNKTLPYLELIRSKLGDVPLKGTSAAVANCYGILQEKLTKPCLLELIWSYWHEEGMLVQTMKAISMRFQNKRGRADLDPMMRFDIDPLRPLGNLLWGYIQDEQHRLTILRRAYEYDHHYGISLQGRAVPSLRQTDSRSKFLEAFHNLLYLCSVFHVSDDDTTVIADGFPVMNGIREVHVLLAEGAHNQFGDLPSTARQEMLIEQWLLARPEMREFLGGRIMVPYSEPWMDRVDTVKRIQGWTDSNISDFHYLAVYGEQIVLSIRYGDWTNVNDPTQAANWARYWRPEIQSYVHSYRAVTGVDLTQDTTESRQVSQRYAQPSVHLRRRLDYQLASKR